MKELEEILLHNNIMFFLFFILTPVKNIKKRSLSMMDFTKGKECQTLAVIASDSSYEILNIDKNKFQVFLQGRP